MRMLARVQYPLTKTLSVSINTESGIVDVLKQCRLLVCSLPQWHSYNLNLRRGLHDRWFRVHRAIEDAPSHWGSTLSDFPLLVVLSISELRPEEDDGVSPDQETRASQSIFQRLSDWRCAYDQYKKLYLHKYHMFWRISKLDITTSSNRNHILHVAMHL